MNPLSGILGEAWQMYKTHAKHLLAIAFVIYLIAAILSALLGLIGTIGLYLALLVNLVAGFILQATLVKAVQDVRDGRADLSISETVNQAMPFIWTVAGASILAGLGIFIGFVLLIVPGLILITLWAVFVPVIVIERSGALDSFGRSRALVRGRAWHVFWTLVLTWIILIVFDIILGAIFTFVPYAFRSGLASVISGTLVAPFIALVVTLIYYRLSSTMAPAAGGPYGGYGSYQQPGQPYGGYQQPPQGSWQQPPQGGWQQPPQGGWQQPPQGGWQQPPQGGWQQPPQPGGSGGDQATQVAGNYPGYQQQPPQDSGNYGGYTPPPPPAGYGGYQQQPQQGGWQQPPQGGGFGGDQPTQQVGSYPGYQQQPPEDSGNYGGYQPGYQQQPPEDSGYQQPPEDSGGYVSKEPPTRQVPRYTGSQPPQDDDR